MIGISLDRFASPRIIKTYSGHCIMTEYDIMVSKRSSRIQPQPRCPPLSLNSWSFLWRSALCQPRHPWCMDAWIRSRLVFMMRVSGCGLFALFSFLFSLFSHHLISNNYLQLFPLPPLGFLIFVIVCSFRDLCLHYPMLYFTPSHLWLVRITVWYFVLSQSFVSLHKFSNCTSPPPSFFVLLF